MAEEAAWRESDILHEFWIETVVIKYGKEIRFLSLLLKAKSTKQQ
jgi:hypothetical protein